MKKEISKIFIVIILYALSAGIFLNFQELWLQENNLSVSTIGIVTSGALFLSIGVIFIFSNYITPNKIKPFLGILLLLNTICIFFLFLLNQSNYIFIIKLLVMIVFILNVEILTALYPLITVFKKNDKLYALKDLIYESSYNIGIVLSSIFIGKELGPIILNYNSYILTSGLLSLITLLIFNTIKPSVSKTEKDPDIIFVRVLKKSFKNNILRNYVLFRIFSQLAYYCVIGMILSYFINGLNLSETFTFNWRIISLVLASLFGFICLKYTPKKDSTVIIIKFGIRVLLYALVCIYPSKLTILITVSYVFITSLIYSHVIEGKYVNIYPKTEQLSFANFSYMLLSLSKALGTFICSLAIKYGIRLNFICALVFTLLQMYYLYKSSKLYGDSYDNKELG